MSLLNCLIFKIDSSLYAVDAGVIVGVENSPALQRLPGQPSFIEGVAEIRNVLTPIINVRNHFNLPDNPDKSGNAILVIRDEGGQKAYLTDGVEAISMLEFDDKNVAPTIIKSFAACVQRMTMMNGNPVIFMDLPSMLTENEHVVLEHFMEQLNTPEEKEEQESEEKEEQESSEEANS